MRCRLLLHEWTCDGWLSINQPVRFHHFTDRYQLPSGEFGRQNATLLSKSLLYKCSYCSVVNYAKTVDDRNSQLFYGYSGKVVWRLFATDVQPSSLGHYYVTMTRGHHRTLLTPSVYQPVVATDWDRWRHNSDTVASCLVLIPSVCRRHREGPNADDTTSTLCRCASSLLPPVDARSRFFRPADSESVKVVDQKSATLLLAWLMVIYCC